RMTGTSEEAFRILDEQNAAIVLLDDSMGSAAFRETHARLCERHGAMGFFLFTITEGKTDDFIQFAAQARIDGLIFRPYRIEELQSRLIETFAVKWPNRYQPSLESSAFVGGIDDEIFKRALEKERRLGYRDTKTPDSKYENVLGLKRIEQAGIKQGKASFEKVRLSFRVVARNGADLEKQVPIHVIEIDAYEATFECVDSDRLENGDHVSIEAEI